MSYFARPVEVGDATLLPGEVLEGSASEVTYLCPFNGPQQGILYVTTYKISFIATEKEPHRKYNAPVGFIHSVEKMGGASSKGEHSYGLEIQLKEFQSFRFAFKQEGHSRREVYDVLLKIAFPLNNGRELFANIYFENLPSSKDAASSGWDYFDMKQELGRIGVPCEQWRLTSINEKYSLCSTYPSVFAVPANVRDSELQAVAAFRSRARLPTLAWLHPENRTSLTRGSQPLVGKFGKRSKEDEMYLTAISKANPRSDKLLIMDARPRLNALANKAMGGGYEDEENYKTVELIFLDIGNIHVMRDSLRKLKEVCSSANDESRWMSLLESSRWLDYIRLIMAGALRIVDLMDRSQVSVFVHCSDGWDRTSQLCSLAMVLMDPYYRTISGFAMLIEKEWLSFGYKFHQRCGHGDRHSGDEQRAPIFVQFVDTVWQVMQQFPSAFEFTEQYLLTILHHLHSCLYGTFLCDNERERRSIRQKTASLWSELERERERYRNPLYTSYMHNQALYPVATIRRLQFWASHYTRWSPRNIRSSGSSYSNSELHAMCTSLEAHCKELQTQLDEKQASEFQNRSSD